MLQYCKDLGIFAFKSLTLPGTAYLGWFPWLLEVQQVAHGGSEGQGAVTGVSMLVIGY